MITAVQPQLTRIQDPERKNELARKSADLLNVATETPPDQPMHTNEHGVLGDSEKQQKPDQGPPHNPGGGAPSRQSGMHPSTTGTASTSRTDPHHQYQLKQNQGEQNHDRKDPDRQNQAEQGHDRKDQGTQDPYKQRQTRQDHRGDQGQQDHEGKQGHGDKQGH
jgi:hypothetical protein